MDVDESLTLIMDKSKEVMRAEASSLLMLDQEAGLLRFHEVCISDSTYREIEGHIAATKLAPVYVKNRMQPVHVYTIQLAPDGEV